MVFPSIFVLTFPSPFLSVSLLPSISSVSLFVLLVFCCFPPCSHGLFIIISEDLELGMKESTQHFSFWVGLGWVISLNTFSSSIYLPEKFTIFSFLQPNRISSCRCTTFSLFICQLKDIQGVPVFELFWIERQWTWPSECVWGMMLNLFGRCQGVVYLAWINLYHLENFPQLSRVVPICSTYRARVPLSCPCRKDNEYGLSIP